MAVTSPSGAAHLGQRLLHGLRRDDHYSFVRRVHINYEDNGARDCESADEKRRHDHPIARREKAEAHEQDEEPDDQDYDERMLNMRGLLRGLKPRRLLQIGDRP